MSTRQIHFGVGTISKLADVLGAARPRRALLVTGRDSYQASGAEHALGAMMSGVEIVRFKDFSPNPVLPDVERGVAICRAFEPDIVVAVGGGSAIDTAKAITLFAAQQTPPATMLTRPSSAVERPRPLIAVPTTAGSGSEATHFATIYVEGIKHSLAHDWLRPHCAIVDPRLTCSMSPQLTAVTALDALSQAIESYWSVGASTESQLLAAQAIGQIWPTLVTAVRAPDMSTRSAMAHGAYLAGCAIDISRTTAAHAISYALTSRYGVPHGLAVALTLGACFEHNAHVRTLQVNDPRGATYVEETMATLCTLLGCRTPAEAAAAWRHLLESVGVATSLQEVGVEEDHLDDLTREVNVERLANHPVRISQRELRDLLRRSMLAG